jgi:hypothetical protein
MEDETIIMTRISLICKARRVASKTELTNPIAKKSPPSFSSNEMANDGFRVQKRPEHHSICRAKPNEEAKRTEFFPKTNTNTKLGHAFTGQFYP